MGMQRGQVYSLIMCVVILIYLVLFSFHWCRTLWEASEGVRVGIEKQRKEHQCQNEEDRQGCEGYQRIGYEFKATPPLPFLSLLSLSLLHSYLENTPKKIKKIWRITRNGKRNKRTWEFKLKYKFQLILYTPISWNCYLAYTLPFLFLSILSLCFPLCRGAYVKQFLFLCVI